jgi:hypothetical protein
MNPLRKFLVEILSQYAEYLRSSDPSGRILHSHLSAHAAVISEQSKYDIAVEIKEALFIVENKYLITLD